MPTSASSYGPYDSGAGANITEAFWRLMTRWFAPSAVVAGYLNELAPFGDSTGLQAKVSTGAAWVRGAYGEWTGITTQGLAAVGGIAGGSERYDRIIVRNDFVNNRVELDVLTGTAGAAPNASRPALTQTTSMWEFLLADVGPLNNATTTVTAAMVLDGRWRMTENGLLFYETVLASAASPIVIPAAGTLPAGLRNINLRARMRSDQAGAGAQVGGLRFNGDTGNNYATGRMDATGTVLAAASTTAGSYIDNWFIPQNATLVSYFGTMEADLYNYAGNQVKAGRLTWSSWQAATLAGAFLNDDLVHFLWNNTAAVTSMTLHTPTGLFLAGSQVTATAT